MSYELVQLGNGAFSLRSLEYGETMHPSIGPLAEAEALYARQLRIAERFAAHRGRFVVWDVGLGAAANAIAVLQAIAAMPGELLMLSFDRTTEPLRFALDHAEQMSYVKPFRAHLEALLETGHALWTAGRLESRPSRRANRKGGFPAAQSGLADADPPNSVNWQLHLGDFAARLNEPLPAPDAILFDPFSPAKNPDMWTAPLFARLFGCLKQPCALGNFSRSTMFRVSLLLAGFYVGRGEAVGRKEETTIAANSLSLIGDPLDRRWLERAQKSHSAEPLWTPVYRKAPLAPSTLQKLRAHPQFSALRSISR